MTGSAYVIGQQARRESACSSSGMWGQNGFSERESEQQRVCIDGNSFWTEEPLKKNTTEETEKHLNKEEGKTLAGSIMLYFL